MAARSKKASIVFFDDKVKHTTIMLEIDDDDDASGKIKVLITKNMSNSLSFLYLLRLDTMELAVLRPVCLDRNVELWFRATMKRLKQLLAWEDRLTISPCVSNSLLSDPIPPDVLMDIVSGLPPKTIAKCRCVSKLWSLILGRPEFNDLFLAKSCSRPHHILFAFIVGNRIPFFTTSPHKKKNSSSLLADSHHHTFSPAYGGSRISLPVRGWVCIEDQHEVVVIFNPLTGQSIPLPRVKSAIMHIKSFFGYDPVDKQFKVLCTTWSQEQNQPPDRITPAKYLVLTLGTEQQQQQLVWRVIVCCKTLRPMPLYSGGICINGVLYYVAINIYEDDVMIVCFDIRSETFSFIKIRDGKWPIGYYSRLINHKGELCIIQPSNYAKIDGETRAFCLWVLKDTEKQHEWMNHVYELPLTWWNQVAETKLRILGMTDECEIVLLPIYPSDPLYLFYYNVEVNIVRKVRVRGFEGFKDCLLGNCSLDYVENLKLL